MAKKHIKGLQPMLYLYIGNTHSMYIDMYKGMLEPICWVCLKVYT